MEHFFYIRIFHIKFFFFQGSRTVCYFINAKYCFKNQLPKTFSTKYLSYLWKSSWFSIRSNWHICPRLRWIFPENEMILIVSNKTLNWSTKLLMPSLNSTYILTKKYWELVNKTQTIYYSYKFILSPSKRWYSLSFWPEIHSQWERALWKGA